VEVESNPPLGFAVKLNLAVPTGFPFWLIEKLPACAHAETETESATTTKPHLGETMPTLRETQVDLTDDLDTKLSRKLHSDGSFYSTQRADHGKIQPKAEAISCHNCCPARIIVEDRRA
jgi:hypothetical protein